MPQDIDAAAYSEGLALAKHQRWYEAEQAFLRAAKLRPEASLAWLSVALMGFHLDHYEDIENAVGWALRAGPIRDISEARRGVERFEAGDWSGAKAEFEKLMAQPQPDPTTYMFMAIPLLKERRFEESFKHLWQAYSMELRAANSAAGGSPSQ